MMASGWGRTQAATVSSQAPRGSLGSALQVGFKDVFNGKTVAAEGMRQNGTPAAATILRNSFQLYP